MFTFIPDSEIPVFWAMLEEEDEWGQFAYFPHLEDTPSYRVPVTRRTLRVADREDRNADVLRFGFIYESTPDWDDTPIFSFTPFDVIPLDYAMSVNDRIKDEKREAQIQDILLLLAP